MCGFLGQYSPKLASKEAFLQNLAIAKHRGPDQTGYWADGQLQLGFNRLAIVDLSEAGHQPMHSQPGHWLVVFNGEIYNHLELRKQFPDYSFKGHSDTETILASLEAKGFEQTIKSLIGMFAISAYHKPSGVLYMARDSVGIKPFFYHNDAGNFWFASQFNQIIKGIGKDSVQLFPEGVRDFLQFGYMQAPNTIYKNIKQLEPGEIAIFDGERIEKKRFCDYQKTNDSGLCDESTEALERFNQLFAKVCKDQLQADVPLATFLSSGIDSTLVNAYSKTNKPDLTAYSIGVTGSITDEREVAGQYASILGVNYISEKIEQKELFEILEDHFNKLGEPFADYSSIPTYLICKKARKSSTVMLSGDGGDELFWGYNRMYFFTQMYQFFKDGLLLRRIKKRLPFLKKAHLGAVYDFEKPDQMVENGQSHIKPSIAERLMKSTPKTKETDSLYHFTGNSSREFRDWMRYNEFYAHMQRVLIKVDRMSMSHGLEVRVPILDQRVVDFAWHLDSNFGFERNKNLKPFLKRALYQFIPEEAVNQKKKGFTVPLDDWLKGELRTEILKTLIDTPLYGNEFIDEAYWKVLVTNYFDNKPSVGEWGIWIMYCWQKWGIALTKL